MFKWMITAALVMSVHLANAQNPFTTEVVADLHEPWAMAVLPDDTLLVTEKKGSIQWLSAEGKRLGQLAGVPDVDYGGQGGLGDIALHPAFEDNNVVYLSYIEAGVDNTRGAAVARGTLNLEGRRPKLTNVDVIWRQYPKVLGRGHFGHRILFDDAGYLWIPPEVYARTRHAEQHRKNPSTQ
jgi:aldose sugar dehydrogenase